MMKKYASKNVRSRRVFGMTRSARIGAKDMSKKATYTPRAAFLDMSRCSEGKCRHITTLGPELAHSIPNGCVVRILTELTREVLRWLFARG